MNRRFFWSILTMSLFLIACSTPSTTSPAQIIGTAEWHLTQLNGTAITTPIVTLQLTDATISGKGFPSQLMGTPSNSIALRLLDECVSKMGSCNKNKPTSPL